MIQLTEEQVGRLLSGRAVTISVGEPWDFTSPDGENVLAGRIASVTGDEGKLDAQRVEIEVTPFEAEHGREVTRLIASARYEDAKGIIERLAAGKDAEVNLSYADQIPEEERNRKVSPFLIGGIRLTS